MYLAEPAARKSTCCTCCTVPRCVYLLYCTPLCVPAGDTVCTWLSRPLGEYLLYLLYCTPLCVPAETVCTWLNRPAQEYLMYLLYCTPLCVPAEDSVYLAEPVRSEGVPAVPAVLYPTVCTCCTVPRCVYLQRTCVYLAEPAARKEYLLYLAVLYPTVWYLLYCTPLCVPAVLYPAVCTCCTVPRCEYLQRTVCTCLSRPPGRRT